MNGPAAERLYQRLPAIHRIRDVDQGQALRALLGVIESEVEGLEEDITRLYDNWFIETCDEWVVAYIGDLLGVRGILPLREGTFSQRGLVANTLGYRRRKGTAAVLEQLARDVTGWPAKAVEFFELLATTQHLNHVRLGKGGTISLRDTNALELLNTPFERAAHTAEVRHIDSRHGKYNIPNVGLFLWRLQSYAIRHGSPRPVVDPADGRYRFTSLGYDAPLFNRPRTETEITHLAEEVNVPDRLRRRALYDELEALRQSLVAGQTPRRVYFGDSPILEVFVQETDTDLLQPIPPEEIVICHLADWKRPDVTTYTPPDGHSFTTRVAVDPVLGRLVFPMGFIPFRVEVSYAYGFTGDLGGGPYNRQSSVEQWYDASDGTRPVTWQRGVTQEQQTLEQSPQPDQLVVTLQEAVGAWNAWAALHPNQFGLITVMDSSTYDVDLALEMPAGSKLAIVAADWPLVEVPDPIIPQKRFTGQLRPDGVRPTLVGNLSVQPTAAANSTAGELILDGLLLEGALTVLDGAPVSLGNLRILHCTLVPGRHLNGAGQPQEPERASLSVGATNDRLTINIDHSIVGPLRLPSDLVGLEVHDSIIDSPARGRPARITPALVSGSLAAVSLSSFTPTINVTIGELGPHPAVLAGVPTNLEEARDLLQQALRGADSSPAFRDARVMTVGEGSDQRLIVLPGIAAALTIQAAPDDATAAELRLEPALARRPYALISGPLTPFPDLSSDAPTLHVMMGHDGPRTVQLASQPLTLAQARDLLQEAIRTAAIDAAPAFASALVGDVDDRLVVLPGEDDIAVLCTAAPIDATTVTELALASDRPAIAANDADERPGPPTTLVRTTVLGPVHVNELTLASETIFTDVVMANRRQAGCVRFSYMPAKSRTPRRYRCQPDLAIQTALEVADTTNSALTSAARERIIRDIRSRLMPAFTSMRYGEPGYAQLTQLCAQEIRTGAEDEGEMGAFNFLQQAHRRNNLRASLDEYLRFGLEAGLFFVT